MDRQTRVALYIDPPSHHFLADRLFDADSARLGGDQLMAPYVHLRDTLNAGGVRVHTADRLPVEPDGSRTVYVSMGMLENYRRLAATRPDVALSAYFAMECPIVEPRMYRALRDAQHYFRRIYSWSDSATLERFVGAPLRCCKFWWPQSFDTVHEAIWRNRDRDFLVMINANKLPRLYWQELYTERMRAVEYFQRNDEIHLYGKGWDAPSMRVGRTRVPYTFRRLGHEMRRHWQRVRPDPLLQAARHAWRGVAESKSTTLGRYTFALCFENSVMNGWITEKLFDCFFAGTVPVYWGAPDITEHVPADCFIDMRQFDGYADLREFLRSLSDDAVEAYRLSARRFLGSPAFHRFSKQAFTEIFVRILIEDAGYSPPERADSTSTRPGTTAG